MLGPDGEVGGCGPPPHQRISMAAAVSPVNDRDSVVRLLCLF